MTEAPQQGPLTAFAAARGLEIADGLIRGAVAAIERATQAKRVS